MKLFLIIASILVLGLVFEVSDGKEEQSTLGSRDPIILAQENNVYILWEGDKHGNPHFDLLFRKSSDSGKSFDKIINLSEGKGAPLIQNYQIKSSDNYVYITWLTYGFENKKNEIYFKKSSDFGESFGKTIPLTLTNKTNYSYNELKLHLSNNDVLVYMEKFDIRNGFPSWVLKQSSDFGESFGKEEVNSLPPEIWKPDKNKIGGLLYEINNVGETDLIYVDFAGEITDNIYTKINEVSTNVTHIFDPGDAKILFDNGNTTYVNWIEGSHLDTGQVFHYLLKQSNDRGKTFGDIIYPFEDPVKFIHHISAKMKGNDLFLLRPNYNNPPYNDVQLFFTKIINDKVETKVIPNPNQYNVLDPQFYISENNIYIIGESYYSAKHCIYFSKSNDNGITFSNIINIDNSIKGKMCASDRSVDKYELPPLKQLKSGISVEDIKCRQDLIDHYFYLLKESDDSPACVKAKNYQKLIQRGWGYQLVSNRFGL